MLLSWLLAAGPVGAAPPAPAAASSSPRPRLLVMAVALDPFAQSELGRLEQFVEQTVVRSNRFELLRPSDVLDPAAAKVRAAKVSEGEAALLAGQKAYDDLDTLKAAQKFSDAVRAFKQTDLTRHLGELSRAWVMKIASMVANQDTRAAQNEMEKLLAVDPRAQFSSNYFSPDALKQVEEARKAALHGKSQLTLRSKPVGARVFVDGRFRGLSPVAVVGLASGEHFVTVLSGGRALFQEPQSAGLHEVVLREAEQAGKLREAAAQVARDPTGRGRDAAAVSLGQAVGAEQVLVAVASKADGRNSLDVVFVRLQTRDGHNLGYEATPLPPGDAMATAVDSALSVALAKDQPRRGEPEGHFTEPSGGAVSSSGPRSPLLSKKPIVYVLIGAGVALIGTGIALGLQANAAHAEYRQTPQLDTATSAEHQGRGQRYALMADLFTVGGLVSGGAGGYLGFLRKDSDAAPTVEAAEAKPERPARTDDDDLRDDR